NTTDSEKWVKYLKNIKCYLDEIKHCTEWAQRKNIKQTLEKSILSKSVTQKNQYKQAYDYIIDLVKGFENREIL
ncbi:10251_t:CDS:2, partial [Dentiscutata heterogama]